MAKFCGNCGARLEDDAKICGKCGTPVEGVTTSIPGLKVTDPEKQKKVKKTFKLVAGLMVLLIVAGIAFNVVSQYTGYNGLMRKVMAAYEKYDIDTLISLSSNMYYYGDEDSVEYYFESKVGENLDSFEASVGHNYKLSYKVNETYAMSERKENDLLDDIENAYMDFDISKIKKVVVADLTLTAKQGNKSTNRDMNIVMTKENGSWRLLYIEQNSERGKCMKKLVMILMVSLLSMSMLMGCSSTVDEPCVFCGKSPSKEYKKSDGSVVCICEKCSSTCMICGEKKATKQYESPLAIAFVCNDCYKLVKDAQWVK